jgi:hypothetical protein
MSNQDRFQSENRCDHGMGLNRPCRSPLLCRVPPGQKELFPHLRIVTDPNKLAQLKAEAARRKRIAGRNCKAVGYRPNA